jgi:ribosomal-protein-alanine N-acetyltransferase
MSATRLVTLDDAPILAELLRANREFLAPWEPTHDEEYFTEDGQRAYIQDVLELHKRGRELPQVILDDAGEVVGRIALNGIVRGFFHSCNMSCWMSASAGGRGFAAAAVHEIVEIAFEELGLHRVQADTMLTNVPAQRVLERNGFVRFGVAPAYFYVNGDWQDHALYQLTDRRHPGVRNVSR